MLRRWLNKFPHAEIFQPQAILSSLPLHVTSFCYPVVLQYCFHTYFIGQNNMQKNCSFISPPTVPQCARCHVQIRSNLLKWKLFRSLFKLFALICSIMKQCFINSPSLFIPIVMHFFKRQAWHWLRCALSTTQRPVPAWHL